MTSASFSHGLLWYFRPAGSRTVACFPLTADVQRGAGGGALISVFASGAGGFLMVTAQLTVSDQAQQALRQDVAAQLGLTAQDVVVVLAPAQQVACRLLIRDGAGQDLLSLSGQPSG